MSTMRGSNGASSKGNMSLHEIPGQTVAILTFTFNKKSGFIKVILKANFKPAYIYYTNFPSIFCFLYTVAAISMTGHI